MGKQRVFLSGATGAMGFMSLKELLKDGDKIDLVILVRPSEVNKKLLQPFLNNKSLHIVWGDLTNYENVKECLKDADVALHVGALVSPLADYHPELAMKTNYGSTVNIVKAIIELHQENRTRLVYIGTVAQTGDRMPPIHWGRVGDPLKPSVFDYYAVSKIASERHVIESGLPYWVSLRQTGIIGRRMAEIEDAIMFHNCLDNVLEYASDRDSARLLRNLCAKERKGELTDNFWGHIFNIGGGEGCRASAFEMYSRSMGRLGIKKLSDVFDSKWFATRNFHGHFYLDSDKLNDILEFRTDTMEYFYDTFPKALGGLATAVKIITKLPGGKKLVALIMRKRFIKNARSEHGTVRYIEENMDSHIAAYWGSKKAWDEIPPLDEFMHFTDWENVVHIDHGYDESKSESELALSDLKGAAAFRGGECLTNSMETGNWREKLRFRCGFGHEFDASARLVLEGGHWCPVCERESWNYYERAKIDPFFAQVWTPLHPADEQFRCYPKEVSELYAADM